MHKRLVVVGFAVLAMGLAGVAARAAENRVKLPEAAAKTFQKVFPKAEITKLEADQENGVTVYDIEFKQEGRKFEADIFADGTIHNWERQVAQGDVPAAVLQTVRQRFPTAALKEIMAVTDVKNGVEQLEGYEIVVQRARRTDVEITIAPDGVFFAFGSFAIFARYGAPTSSPGSRPSRRPWARASGRGRRRARR